ncbi:hypothetical protein RhiirA5_426150 [Rhizophagus irregularis]|uniref:Uncharacterized protein n=1 Tax=Rhizophagus irregularis TaxID=588596 RepID=A0A2I1E6I3_9GLOM|nr:hypothetical protein RhiirA5_426150 [Rhizophagus irregularis]PKC75024.1 hypothetical protein RhiirA1_449324 [Rhizophagus irregularis]PKY17726.1 hypothetical protein RhiirB3_430404 [Rhizophagus irregularis]CAB4463960.1 unnamed protein product [Rhizophagus irregularis]CAB5308990.1 unnamed protein product [Rhizophagus irregularis]
MKGDSNNNSALRIISLYKLYYNDSDFQLYFANESSYVGNNYKPTGMLKFYPNMTNYLYNNSLIPKRTYVNKLNHRCMTFIPQNEFVRHPYYERHPLLFVITLDTNSSIYDYFEIVFKSFYTATKFDINEKIKLGFNERFLTPGRYYKYTFNYKYTKYYSNPLSGLFGFDADDGDMNIVIEDNVLAQIPNSTFNTVNTVLELSHYYNIIVNDDIMTFKNNVVKLIENFGGFYGAISGIFVLLFGASKLSPWGICQIHLLRCWPCRRRFKERLASRYVSRAGIPLVEDPYNLPENGRIEDRVAILEILLKEYYIDDYYLDELRKTREKYIRILGDENA